MAVLARPSDKTEVFRVENKEKFIKQFNGNMPSKETKKLAKNAMKITKWVK